MMFEAGPYEDLIAQRSAGANKRLRGDAYRQTSSNDSHVYSSAPRRSYSFQDQRSTEALPYSQSPELYDWRSRMRSESMPLSEGFAKDEMLRLLRLAEDYVGEQMEWFENFYRDKPNEYWNGMPGHLMTPYLKDYNGHSASPINGIIDGLFFSSKLFSGKLPKTSIFGDRRLILSAQYLLAPDSRLYFADFYCNSSEDGCFGAGIHYVTIVITRRGSRCDEYCQGTLVELDPWANKFICLVQSLIPGRVSCRVNANHGVWIEAYYTEAVDVRFGSFCVVEGKGQSHPKGVANNKFCHVCNLYPLKPSPRESARIAAGGRIHNGRIAPGKRKLTEDYSTAKRRKTEESQSAIFESCSPTYSERSRSPRNRSPRSLSSRSHSPICRYPYSGFTNEAHGSQLQDGFSGPPSITATETYSNQLHVRHQLVAKRRRPGASVIEKHSTFDKSDCETLEKKRVRTDNAYWSDCGKWHAGNSKAGEYAPRVSTPLGFESFGDSQIDRRDISCDEEHWSQSSPYHSRSQSPPAYSPRGSPKSRCSWASPRTPPMSPMSGRYSPTFSTLSGSSQSWKSPRVTAASPFLFRYLPLDSAFNQASGFAFAQQTADLAVATSEAGAVVSTHVERPVQYWNTYHL